MQAALALSTPLSRTGSGLPPPHEFTFFCEVRHDEPLPAGGPDQQGPACVAGAQQSGGGAAAAATHASGALVGPTDGMVSKWSQKERLKTTAVALVMCLNIGGCAATGRAMRRAVTISRVQLAAVCQMLHPSRRDQLGLPCASLWAGSPACAPPWQSFADAGPLCKGLARP